MKNIIITGTGAGIGYELALKFADAGHHVLAISRRTPQALMAHSNITCLPVDLAKESELEKVRDFLPSWRTADAIVHNAGSLIHKPFSETSTEDFEKIYRVNVFAVAALTRIVL